MPEPFNPFNTIQIYCRVCEMVLRTVVCEIPAACPECDAIRSQDDSGDWDRRWFGVVPGSLDHLPITDN